MKNGKKILLGIVFVGILGVAACTSTNTLPQDDKIQPTTQVEDLAEPANARQPDNTPQPVTLEPVESGELAPINELEPISVTKVVREEPMPETPQPTPSPPSSQEGLVEFAKEDLSRRLGVTAVEIDLLKFESVVWPDGSLGCPQPGLAYIQVLVEGYRILLNYQGKVFSYHGRGNQAPFLCEDKSAPDDTLLPPPGFDK